MSITIDLTNKVILVTGAASGLGRATAIALAKAGAKLALVDVRTKALNDTQTLLHGSKGALHDTQVLLHVADLTQPEACRDVVEETAAHFGQLDGLCNIAGLIHLDHSHEMPLDRWQQTIALNLTAPFLLSQAAIPHLLKSDGAIVNCASAAAFMGEAYAAAYCATKAGLVNMTKAMAMEYMHQKIRINAVAPGGMMTGIADNLTMPDGADMALIARFHPLRGLVEVADVAGVFAMLCSDAGRGYHGACITIDRGITAG